MISSSSQRHCQSIRQLLRECWNTSESTTCASSQRSVNLNSDRISQSNCLRGSCSDGSGESVWSIRMARTVLHWLSKNAGLTSECVTEVIEPFTRQWSENMTMSATWNEAEKCAAAKQVMWPPPCPLKAVGSTTSPLHGDFDHIHCSIDWLMWKHSPNL